jgi:hypothetical protein
MTITATTLSAACGASDPTISVTSATYALAGNFTTGSNITWALIDEELMLVVAANGTIISVLRGQNGTQAAAHASGANIQFGLPTDFPFQNEYLARSTTTYQTEGGMIWPATNLTGTADAIPAGVPGFYVINTVAVDTCTLATPTAAAEGIIINVWTGTATAHKVVAPSTLFLCSLGSYTTATFGARIGVGFTVRACNGSWHVMNQSYLGTTSSSVVLS